MTTVAFACRRSTWAPGTARRPAGRDRVGATIRGPACGVWCFVWQPWSC